MKEGYLRLGDVCEVQNGFAFDSKFFSTNKESGMPLIRIRDILKGHSCTYYTSSYQEEYIVHKGEFLIGMDGDFNIGQWQSEDALLNQRVCRLLPSDKIIPKFIFYFIPTALQKINAETSYATVKHLSSRQIKEILIPNISLTEQQRIVALLDAEFAKIDALKANAEKNLQNAKDLFQAALKKELEPKEGWQKKTIKDVCSIFGRIGYRGYTRNDLVDNAEEGAITLSPSNIVDNEMVYDKVTYISWFKYEESPEIMIFDDDILLVKTGSSYGKCALVKNLPHKATINPQFVVLKNININRCFLNYYLRTPYSKARFDEFVSGTAIPTFSQANLGNMSISFPSIKEQQSIVSHLDTLNEKCKTLQANYEKTLSLCDDLKQALLRKAFNGEL